MSDYVVTMERSSGLRDAQVKSRLSRVYTLLITLARRAEERETADGETLAGEPAAGDARPEADASTGQLRSAGLSGRRVPVA